MKENAIKKINKVGHIGFIFSKIIKVCLIIGFVGCIIGEAALLVLPTSLFKVTVNSSAEVVIDSNSVVKVSGQSITQDELIRQIEKYAAEGTLEVDDEEFSFGEITVKNGNLYISGTSKDATTITVAKVRGTVALSMLVIACAFAMIIFVSNLCKALETCETPFSAEIITSLNRFAYALLGYVIIGGSLSSIASSLVGGGDSNIGISLNVPAVLIALAVYALTVVFKYGAILQQESDETL